MSRPTPTQPPGTLVSHYARHRAGASAEGAVDAWVFGMTFSGAADIIAPRPIRATPDTGILIRPRTFNAWTVAKSAAHARAAPHWDVLYCVFIPRPHWYPWLQFEEFAPGYSLISFSSKTVSRQIRKALLRTHELSNGSFPQHQEFAINTLECALLHAYSDRAADIALDPRVRSAAAHLRAHAAEAMSMKGLAAACGTSRSHLAALFRSQMGCGPIAYHERERLEQAGRLLRMSYDSIGAVAAAVGYADAKYFSKRFHKHFAMTPRAYRAF